MPQSAAIISGIQRMVLYETRAVSVIIIIITPSQSGYMSHVQLANKIALNPI